MRSPGRRALIEFGWRIRNIKGDESGRRTDVTFELPVISPPEANGIDCLKRHAEQTIDASARRCIRARRSRRAVWRWLGSTRVSFRRALAEPRLAPLPPALLGVSLRPRCHHARGPSSPMKAPVGPLSGSVASWTMTLAASDGGRSPRRPLMSVAQWAGSAEWLWCIGGWPASASSRGWDGRFL